jgi:hypothetical protein
MPNWWGRHWKWLVAIGTLLAILIYGSAMLWLYHMANSLPHQLKAIQNHETYRFGLEQASGDPRVIAALGSPIVNDGKIFGKLSAKTVADMIEAKWSHARLSGPISGPHAKATLSIEASSQGGIWKFATLTVTHDGSDRPIDLLAGLPATRKMTPEEIEKMRERYPSQD